MIVLCHKLEYLPVTGITFTRPAGPYYYRFQHVGVPGKTLFTLESRNSDDYIVGKKYEVVLVYKPDPVKPIDEPPSTEEVDNQPEL